MASVTLNGLTFNSTTFPNYGYLDDTTGLFAMLDALVDELAAADTVQSVTATVSQQILVATSTAWAARDPANESQFVYASQYFG